MYGENISIAHTHTRQFAGPRKNSHQISPGKRIKYIGFVINETIDTLYCCYYHSEVAMDRFTPGEAYAFTTYQIKKDKLEKQAQQYLPPVADAKPKRKLI